MIHVLLENEVHAICKTLTMMPISKFMLYVLICKKKLRANHTNC
ncbi:hypothetical protein Ccrd_026016 [Cynara cardunculus var. scolymus]|uniref:Uncharacterized protein n=1 Tax=Cynara cardunculus var. scolymus TaxID=59895 RepID=A0A103XDD7_CYNCS|nr:hypothetical protein Ccrd_026016 [Cynara cardunculus var. scolymus]